LNDDGWWRDAGKALQAGERDATGVVLESELQKGDPPNLLKAGSRWQGRAGIERGSERAQKQVQLRREKLFGQSVRENGSH
jgi:hypothetical protein